MLIFKTAEDDARPARPNNMRQLLNDMFLPAGYPDSVSPDYTRYQIYNALQAFCSSLAGLLASRAVLEGFGVGDASASATNAILVNVLQDVCSRVTTIFGAYAFGTSLFPEAKTYRLLADVLNDFAMALDVLSPYFNSLNGVPDLPPNTGTVLRVAALCVSSCARALCGMAAGGSKAAITLHFTQGLGGTADVGDLNAKDGSKETVLALVGVLCGSVLVPQISTGSSTYTVLALLLIGHLYANYQAVRGVHIRTLNRQRVALLWRMYAAHTRAEKAPVVELDPAELARHERVLCRGDILFDFATGRRLARCAFLDTPHALVRACALPCSTLGDETLIKPLAIQDLVDVFRAENYAVWYPEPSARRLAPPDTLYITMFAEYTPRDLLKAWVAATQCAWSMQHTLRPWTADLRLATVDHAQRRVAARFDHFVESLERSGWDVAGGLLYPGTPAAVDVYTYAPSDDDDFTESEIYSEL